METTRLYIARHGQTEANNAGVLQGISQGNLTPTGIEQAKKLGVRLRHEQLDVIISSDLERAKQTVAQVVPFHHLPVQYEPLIREWNVGVFDLRPKSEYRAALAASGQTQASFRPPGGENFYDVATRAKKFLQQLENSYQGKNILICTHGDFIRTFICILLNRSIEEAPVIPQENAALNIFEVTSHDAKEIMINSTDHLE